MNKEPLIHISKRGQLSSSRQLAIRLFAILLSLVFCGIVTLLVTGLNPLKVYGTMIQGCFGSARKTWILFQNLSILLIISLAVTPAFKMRFWNIGAEGQVLIGCLASASCMILLGGKLPNWTVNIIMVFAAMIFAGIWALIPAIFKAKWNTNETLFTLMMNYVATQLVAYFVIIWENPKGSGKMGIINQNTQAGWLPTLFSQKQLLPVLVAVVLTIFVYIYLNYTKHGYELAVVGESERTARYVGIKVESVILRTMFLSGLICGIAGLLMTGSINHTLSETMVGGQGFTAVMVSWLAQFNPIAMIFSSFLLVFMGKGATEIATSFSLNESYSDILTGIILFFIIGCEFFINYKITLRKSGSKEV